jgi:hypothetical protein
MTPPPTITRTAPYPATDDPTAPPRYVYWIAAAAVLVLIAGWSLPAHATPGEDIVASITAQSDSQGIALYGADEWDVWLTAESNASGEDTSCTFPSTSSASRASLRGSSSGSSSARTSRASATASWHRGTATWYAIADNSPRGSRATSSGKRLGWNGGWTFASRHFSLGTVLLVKGPNGRVHDITCTDRGGLTTIDIYKPAGKRLGMTGKSRFSYRVVRRGWR